VISTLLLASFILGPTGCALQTKIIQRRHWQLNDTIRATHIEQLLLNIFRLRYDDTPYFLQVSSVSTQFSAQGSGQLPAGGAKRAGS
jgi:hypothetical protein